MVSTCGPFRFTCNFDSGNFLKTELLENRLPGAGQGIDYETAVDVKRLDYELNVWTRPDCYGSPYENGNRTWFHFGIRGGKSLGSLKLNILNLNKQVKLFHQGMQPVYRILPERPYWERIPDRLIVNETLDHICSISFGVRLPEDTKKSTLYIAFSYPYSYAELREWLAQLDSIFVQPFPPEFTFDRIKLPFPKQAEVNLVASAAMSVENEIYYHRECACYSLEKRTVDLITVTSLYGMSSVREERLLNLFPDTSQPRPYLFPSKKVVFLSARVHPGETPSTFVLNGFFKFILERHDPRAILLRRLFVFKLMPMLNPDGVARGHYRTDPRGVNLNRVYCWPSPILHPSIYAARKLLLYYHYGRDIPDDYDYPVESQQPQAEVVVPSNVGKEENTDTQCATTNVVVVESKKSSTKITVQKCTSIDNVVVTDSNENNNTSGIIPAYSGSKSSVSLVVESNVSVSSENKSVSSTNSKYTFVLSDTNSLCAGCTITPYEKNQKGKSKTKTDSRRPGCIDKKKKRKSRAHSEQCKKRDKSVKSQDVSANTSSSSSVLRTEVASRIMIENDMDSIPMLSEPIVDTVTMENVEMDTDSHQCDYQACDDDSILYTSDISSNAIENASISRVEHTITQSKTVLSEKKEIAGPSNTSLSIKRKITKKVLKAKGGSEAFGLTVRKHVDSPQLKLREKKFQKDPFGSVSLNTRSSAPKQQSACFNESPSGIFLYIDMHGHATKRGIFMYGNHFPDAATQAECMLLPRLMAMNCQHFDFAACNFTERLMNMKDRRDGASREGSGRVACLKLTGLIRSYTLECNYNTGRLVNPVVNRQSTANCGFVDLPIVTMHHSPKFTPDIFEVTGKALAESVLDLSGHNPWSRLGYTEFKTLEGMRRWIANRLLHSPEYNQSRTTNIPKDKVLSKKSSSTTGITTSSGGRPSSACLLKTPKKRTPRKRSGSTVLVEVHSHHSGTASKLDDITGVPAILPVVAAGSSRTVTTTPARRRSSLPNRLNCYVVPPMTRTKETIRRDPPAR